MPPRILKEPLLHFVVLAAALFGVSYFFADTPSGNEPDKIVVGEQRIKSLMLGFHRTWQRPPTQQELDAMIEDYIKEEVFYREALAMGLDQDDTLIRRRLRQKLEFVAEDIADTVEPTDEQLQQLLSEQVDRYREEGRATFNQVYLSREGRGDKLASDAAQLLDQLRSDDSSVDPTEEGDSSLLSYHQENLRESEIENMFGPGFGQRLLSVEPNTWSGPVESAYGLHLVLLQEKSEGRVPELDEVRPAVRRDWFAQQRAATKAQFFGKLRDKYQIVVEKPDFAETNDGEPPAE